MSDTQFYPLTVSKVKQETEDTVSIFLTIPSEQSSTFQYTQGQYLTLRFTINGQEERRAYSMSSSPVEPELAVTVKRVAGGKVSNHINDQLKAGDAVDVMPPQGRFFTTLDPEQRKNYYLFGAGSGITPLMSILKTIVEEEPKSTVHLLYGSRHDDQIIFYEELGELEARYAGQLYVTYIVSQPKKEKKGWLKKSTVNWAGRMGRIINLEVDRFLEEHPLAGNSAEYFVCGPGAMIDTVEACLIDHGVAKTNIHTERFVNAAEAADKKAQSAGGAGQVTVTLRGDKVSVQVPEEKTILDALLADKHDAPYSCMAGACSTCMAKVVKGQITMDACYALDDDEVADGFILACQSHPQGEGVEITFDV